MKILKTWRAVATVVLLCTAIGAMTYAYRGASVAASGGVAVVGAQDVTSLDRRISALEQRLYSIESSINRLAQQASLTQRMATSPTTTGGRSDLEISLLSAEIASLKNRLREAECGLVKLDERTTATRRRGDDAARETRPARPGADRNATDPCRLNPDAPLELSTRP